MNDNSILVNTHIHTPWSFSSFDSIAHAVTLAAQQNIGVLGISDFNSIEGYVEFSNACIAAKIHPLFCIEFIALLDEDKGAGRRWNDPQNPGIMYFCGKALNHPATLSVDSKQRLLSLWKGTQDQIQEVILKLNDHLESVGVPVSLEYTSIRSRYAKKTVRERHIARALSDVLREKFGATEALLEAIKAVCRDQNLALDHTDNVAVQNELRNRLLKAGAPAFVEEKPSAFLSLEAIQALILDGGGIPCYPVLADDSRALNEKEADVDALAADLMRREIHAVEFIPSRNTLEHLKKYVLAFHRKGFCVTFGTEHNTPDLGPMLPHARKKIPFDAELNQIAYQGACVLAAHQELHHRGKPGFVDHRGHRLVDATDMAHFAQIGDTAIRQTINK